MWEYTRQMARQALGQEKAPLVLKHGKILQVLTNEILEADIAISQGVILGVGSYDGLTEIDLKGQYVVPGFVDAHLHLESTLVNPGELIQQAGLKGTTTFIVDPHEAANVSGKAGIDYILRETEDAQANVYVMMPSCVPAGPYEDNGCAFDATDMAPYLSNPRVLGLGEVMDCDGVLSCRADMLEKLRLFRDKIMDGHAGYLGEKETSCYALSGIATDHECTSFEDALREMRAGLQVLIREGTAAKNLESIIRGVVDHKLPCHQLAFCTDDKHIEDIISQGHISYNIKKAISLGLDPVEAYKIASFYPARRYGLKQLGAIAPGYQADLVVLSDLHQVEIQQVYHRGQPVQEQSLSGHPIPDELLHTVHVALPGDEPLALPLGSPVARVVELQPGEILTREIQAAVPVEQGCFASDGVYQKLAVLERHHGTGKIGLGIVKGFSLHGGAIASTVGHDSHNLIVVGDNDEDMLRAIEALKAAGGGYAVAETGKPVSLLPLEIMGLISRQPYAQVEQQLKAMLAQARAMGVPDTVDPFITLSFLALPVIPQVRITTRGLYDVTQGRFQPVSVEPEAPSGHC